MNVELARMPLFEGLDAAALEQIREQMRPRRFDARTFICRQGEPGDSLLLIQRGLAQVTMERPEGILTLGRLRRGDVVGEISLLTGEPRSAHVLASVPTDVLELGQEAFAALVARYPILLANLTRILSHRLVQRNVQQIQSRRRGEVVALVLGQRGAALAAAVMAATQAASPGSMVALDLTGLLPGPKIPLEEPTVEGALVVLDDLLSAHAGVVAVAGTGQENLPLLLEQVDRTVVVASETEVRSLEAILSPFAESVEVILLTEAGGPHTPALAPVACGAKTALTRIGGVRVIRAFDPEQPGTREAGGREIAWLGRHLSRTKLGLALGAGGAKGYAHVGALHVLQEAGYTVDYVAGSSIGAMVGAWLALGRDAAEIEATMRRAFTPENVEAMFKLSFAGTSVGLDVMIRLCQETTDRRSFADLVIPLVVMAADLNTRRPAPITEGPLWEALLAATALAGLFPPYQRGEQRLVDGLALVPVPTGSVIEAGADITVSVNIINRETLPAWPGESAPEPAPAPRGPRMLDTLLEVMDLAQLDSGARHAALADVVITPRFGPASWRDFHLADLFLAAGRQAAEEQLPSLQTMAKPQSTVLHN